MAVAWKGPTPIAIVPVWNELVDTQPDGGFRENILQRIFYDPQAATSIDDSLQNYVWTISYGQATISGALFPTVRSPNADVTGAAMDSLPVGHGYTHLLAVLPHAFGANRGAWAWWDLPPRNGITSFARVALFQEPSQTLRQPSGVWAMETLHMVTQFGDLYNVSPSMGNYDVMASASSASHPSAHTKSAMGWIASTGIALHGPGSRKYVLHAIGLRQPAPPGRITAVRIPSRSGGRSFLVEARLEVDQYERQDAAGDGIPAEGVIVYEVASELDVRLRTAVALGVGKTYTNSDEGITVKVAGAVPGGRTVTITRTESPQCDKIRATIETLIADLADATSPDERRLLLVALGQARKQAIALGCGPG